MSTSQQAANAANAAKSTGPKTPEGKQRVRCNARKHNFTGQIWVTPEEERKAYDHFSALNLEVLNPLDAAQRLLADQIVELRYRIRRMASFESAIIAIETQNLSNSEILDSGDPIINAALDVALAFDRKLPRLDLMARYENRFQRQVRILEAEYKQLQADRANRLRVDLPNAIRAYNYHKRKGLAFDPAEFGFVCTVAEIEARLRRQEIWNEIETGEKAIAKATEDAKPRPKKPGPAPIYSLEDHFRLRENL